MRKFAISFVLLALLLSSTAAVIAQTRPRRVGKTPPVTATTAPTQPTTTPAPQPEQQQQRRPPVLGGANNTGNTQQNNNQTPVQTPTKDEPVELGEGDILRVSTTLVTVPVSVLDRGGKYVPNLRKEDFRIYEEGAGAGSRLLRFGRKALHRRAHHRHLRLYAE
jgi:hypothetical protein